MGFSTAFDLIIWPYVAAKTKDATIFSEHKQWSLELIYL